MLPLVKLAVCAGVFAIIWIYTKDDSLSQGTAATYLESEYDYIIGKVLFFITYGFKLKHLTEYEFYHFSTLYIVSKFKHKIRSHNMLSEPVLLGLSVKYLPGRLYTLYMYVSIMHT